jgi:hypothetical protein
VLGKIFGPKRDEVTGDWRRLHNEVLNDLYSSPNIICVLKSRKLGWMRHVAIIGDHKCICSFGWKTQGKAIHLEDLGIGERTMLKWIFKK